MFLTTTDRQVIEYLKAKYELAKRDPQPLESLVGQVHNMDASDYLRLFPDNSVKLIFTDEPYGQANTHLNLKARSDIMTDFQWGKVNKFPAVFDDLIRAGGVKEPTMPTHLYTEWIFEAARVLQEHGHLINFGFSEFAGTMHDVSQNAGLVWRASGPWIKTNPAPHFRKSTMRSGYENFFVMSKGTTKGHINFMEQQEMINYQLDANCPNCGASHPVIMSNQYIRPKWFDEVETWTECSSLTNKQTKHQTEKPEWLITKFLSIYSNPGDVVVDPFCGSASTAVVANRMGRKWAINDLTPEWYEQAKIRMSTLVESFG